MTPEAIFEDVCSAAGNREPFYTITPSDYTELLKSDRAALIHKGHLLGVILYVTTLVPTGRVEQRNVFLATASYCAYSCTPILVLPENR